MGPQGMRGIQASLIGVTPAESNATYDKLIKDHPSLVLALNHIRKLKRN